MGNTPALVAAFLITTVGAVLLSVGATAVCLIQWVMS